MFGFGRLLLFKHHSVQVASEVLGARTVMDKVIQVVILNKMDED